MSDRGWLWVRGLVFVSTFTVLNLGFQSLSLDTRWFIRLGAESTYHDIVLMWVFVCWDGAREGAVSTADTGILLRKMPIVTLAGSNLPPRVCQKNPNLSLQPAASLRQAGVRERFVGHARGPYALEWQCFAPVCQPPGLRSSSNVWPNDTQPDGKPMYVTEQRKLTPVTGKIQ